MNLAISDTTENHYSILFNELQKVKGEEEQLAMQQGFDSEELLAAIAAVKEVQENIESTSYTYFTHSM